MKNKVIKKLTPEELSQVSGGESMNIEDPILPIWADDGSCGWCGYCGTQLIQSGKQYKCTHCGILFTPLNDGFGNWEASINL